MAPDRIATRSYSDRISAPAAAAAATVINIVALVRLQHQASSRPNIDAHRARARAIPFDIYGLAELAVLWNQVHQVTA